MSKEYKKRVGSLPTVDPVSKPQDLRVVARPVDQTVAPDINDTMLSGLVQGLASVNPQLQQYVQQKNTTDAHSAYEAGTAQAQRESIGIIDPNKAILSPEAMPANIEPAFSKQFQKGYREVLGQKVADKLQADFLGDWNKVRMNADVDSEQFLREWVAKNTAGFDDPVILGPVTQRLVETTKAIRSDSRSIQMALLERSTREGIDASFGQITPDMTTEQMMSTYFTKVLPMVKQTNFVTSTEAAGKLLDRVRALSTAMGGAPELFDAMKEFKDPSTGKSLYEMNPKLAEQIDIQRKEADTLVTQKLEKAMQPVHFQKHIKWEEQAAAGNPPSMDEILSQMGSLGMYKTHNEAASAYLHFQKKADGAREARQALLLIQSGNGAALPEKDQKKYMDMVTDPLVAAVFDASNQGNNPQAFNMAAGQLIQAHKGMSVPNTRLQNLFGTIRQAMPGKDEVPSPRFKMLANLYAQLPANLQTAYVTDEDSRLILSRYNEARSGGSSTQLDEKSALAQAYASVTPEAKEAGRQFAATAEGREAIRKKLHNTFGVVGWRAAFGAQWMGTYPTNEEDVTRALTQETRSYIERMGGHVSTDEAMKWAQQRFAEKFVYDRSANRYVEVPPTQAGEATADALSAYTEQMSKKFPGTKPYLIHMGDGKYQVRSNEVGNNVLAFPTLQEIKDDFYATKNLDPRTREGSRLMALQEALNKGTVTPDQLNKEADLIAKARSLGIWDAEMGKKIDDARRKAFDGALSPILRDVPQGTLDGVDMSRLPSNGTNLKADIAKAYVGRGNFGKAMTVMGEGVVLQRYKDQVGVDTIGIGYNLTSNARTLAEDFRRAGIPADAVEDVKAGKKAITTEQAMRLFEVSYGRAEMSAQQSIERLFGKGSWDRLASNRKAVLTDVAYQVGSVDQFKPTLDKFIAELGESRDQNLIVHFRDKATGQMRPDTGRNNLRLALLNGELSMHGILDRVSGVPRNKIEAQALLNPK